MILSSTSHFDRRLAKKIRKNLRLKNKVGKQLNLLKEDVGNPSLKIHRLKGKRAQEYAIWIEGDIRITFQITRGSILLTDIITHDEY